MSLPLKTRLFDAFLGQSESIHSLILPDIFSPGESFNVYIDKFARVKKIAGYLKKNATAVTTNTGGSAVGVVGLFPYRTIIAGVTTRQVIGIFDDGVNEWEAWYSTDLGATWTFASDFGAASINKIPDFVQFANSLFLTNGVLTPRVWNGTAWSVAGGTQSPTPTVALSGVTGVLKGDYNYKLVSRKTDGNRSPGSATSSVKGVTDGQLTLSWTADADTDVKGYEVYRTTGTGQTLFFVSWVDGRTSVAYYDNVSDETALGNRALEEHGDAPPVGTYFGVPHKQRIWWLRTDTFPTRGYFSDAGDPDSVYSFNNLEFSDSETMGDVITGGFGNFEGNLVVFTERSVWTVSGTGQLVGNIRDWTRTKSTAQIGAVSKRSLVRIPPGAKYADQNGVIQTLSRPSIAFFSPYGDIRLFADNGDTIISLPVRETLSAFEYANRAKVHALHDSVNQQVIWFYPTIGGTSRPSEGVVWNYRWGVWYPWTDMPFMSSTEAESWSDSQVMLVGQAEPTTGGLVYEFFVGTSFDGASIASQWATKTIRGLDQVGAEDISHTQRWRWIDLLFEVISGATVNLDWFRGTVAEKIGTTVVGSGIEELITIDPDVILTADGDSIIFNTLTSQTKALLHGPTGRYLHDTGIRLKFYDDSATTSWALEGFNIAYQTLPGMKRRSG